MTSNSDTPSIASQQTLGGETIEEEPSHYPDIAECDACGQQTVLDGVLGMEHGGQVLCHRGCTREPVAFVAFCASCGREWRFEGVESDRWASRQLAQSKANSHESSRRVFELIHHETGWREVAV